jgi:phage shock protein A
MNLLERVLTLLRANLDTMAERSEDPEKMLRQIQLDMRNQLVQVKTQVATAIAEGMKLQKRSKEKETEAEQWLKKAEQAIRQNNEHAARDFLTRYNALIRQAQRYQQQQKEQEQLVVTMRGILRQLEAKISEVDTTIELLAARKRSALLQQRVYETLSKSGSPKDRERALHAQDALLEIEARARALADLQQRDLDTQLEQISHEHLVESQLQQLKQKASPSPDRPLQLDEKAQPARLDAPAPQQSDPVKKRNNGRQPTNNPAAATPPGEVLDLEALRKLMDK